MALATLTSRLAAQCPDGSQACRTAAAVRHDPPLDDHTWLVLPFESKNMRDTASDLVHEASVSLLYQEMSRWQDVRVIPDVRVADLLRTVPAAEQQHLGFAAATGLARRAGAGRLVLGSYFALRGRAFMTATVFDVVSGRQIRVVRDTVWGLEAQAALDSLGATVGRMSRRILAIPIGAQLGSGGLSTSSIEAYRAYTAGVAAANRFALDTANAWLDRALAYDSAFALAHLRRWQYGSAFGADNSLVRPHLLAAVRLADGLPPRERGLVEALAAAERQDFPQLCAAAHRLVADDSASADGWLMLTMCYTDSRPLVEGEVVRWRGDPTHALAAVERAYALDPQSLGGFTAWLFTVAFDVALSSGGNPDDPYRMVCADEGVLLARCPIDRLYRATPVTIGTSVSVRVQPWLEARHHPADLEPDAVAEWQRRAKQAGAGLDRFRQSAPDSWLLNWIGAVVALETGDTAGAARAYGRGVVLPFDTVGTNRSHALSTGLVIALARGRLSDARAYADTLVRRRNNEIHYQTMFGRFGEGADTTASGKQVGVWRQIFAGILPAGVDTLESSIAARLTGPTRDDFLQLSTLAAFHMRGTGPALDTSAVHPLKRAQAWIARHDTARARAALIEFDRELTGRHLATPDDGGWLFSAETHLELGDSAVAFERMKEFARRWVYEASSTSSTIMEQWYWQRPTPRLWARAWLLFSDLAMAFGQPGEAQRGYTMVVGFWEKGDAPVQPMVARAKAALAKLGS